jgi:RNA polymerase sigma-54 factor
MRFETSQHMKFGQHMKLAPRMIQSMEILQMPLAELEERIERELESNATLEVAEGESDANEVAATQLETRREDLEGERPMQIDEKSGLQEFERLDSFEESNPDAAENEFSASDSSRDSGRFDQDIDAHLGSRRFEGERDAKMDAMAAAPARAASVVQQLRDQWSLCEVDETLRPLGDLIISFLDDDGYLRTPLETIADRAPLSRGGEDSLDGIGRVFKEKPTVADLERALKAVQLFLEPSGVGARDARECLLLQLDTIEADGEDLGWPGKTVAAARSLIEHHLDDLLQNRLPKVAEKTGLTLDEINEAMMLMRRLSLAPGRRLQSETATPITPDAIVEYDAEADRYVAYLNDTRLPNLRINREYAMMSKNKAMPTKDRDFLKTNLTNAQWLIDAVNQRRHTLLRVVRAVVEAQRDFFDYGPQALKPLPMTGVAEQLGIHVATVSRAVAEKYLATPRGVVPLRKFFSGGLQTTGDNGSGGGEQMAWDAIKAAMQKVVDGEDKSKPFSDDALVDEMKKQGIEIARRTVAKYREQLGIPTARLRKKF